PSAKYAFAFSSLRFSNGKTAILFSGIGEAMLSSESVRVTFGDPRRKKIEKLTANAKADKSKATMSVRFGQTGGLIGRTVALVVCFHLFPCLSFPGRAELPRPSL